MTTRNDMEQKNPVVEAYRKVSWRSHMTKEAFFEAGYHAGRNDALQWHYIKDEGLPKFKDNKARAYLICYRVPLADVYTLNDHKIQVPNGKFIESCTIALIQKKESKDGFTYTPAKKFYWGCDIYDTAYAWAELPKAIPYEKMV